MGAFSVYYVPHDQEKWSGQRKEIEKLFWPHGIALHDFDALTELNNKMKENKEEWPETKFEFSFGYMGVVDEEIMHPVPYELYDNWSCPQCSEKMDYQYIIDNSDAGHLINLESYVTCRECNQKTTFKNLKSEDDFALAKVYIYIGDVDPNEWVPLFLGKVQWNQEIKQLVSNKNKDDLEVLFPGTMSFKTTVESILGPCTVYSNRAT